MHSRFAISGAALRALAASNQVRGAAAFVSVAAVGSVAYVRSYPSKLPPKDPEAAAKGMPRPVMEAICGAVGEAVQVCVLFPVETVKVRCQSDGLSAAAVLQQLAVQGKRNALRQLYNGFGTAAVLSIFVGAVHYASFCVTRRLALQAGASDAAAVPASGGGGGHGAAHQPEGSTTANLFAAAVGAMATALVESPAELLRHQAQAGMPVENVAHAFKTGGVPGVVGALYGGSFIPFLIESFPYDLMELGTYSGLGDTQQALAKRDTQLGRFVASVPNQAWDIFNGAAAGTAATLVSMPFDVIKTYMQTHCAEMAALGVRGQVNAFIATGAKLVAAQGPGALFVGTAPRLLQQVPSTTLCWWALEQCRGLLEPYTRP